MARKRAMQQYGIGQRAAESVRERGDRQAHLGVQQRIADTNAQNVASQMQERGFGIQTAQRKAEQEQKVGGLQQQLAATDNPEARTALMRQIKDLTDPLGAGARGDPLSSRVNAARAILGDMEASEQERATAREFLSGALGNNNAAAPYPGARQAPDGKWYVQDPKTGKYSMVQG